MRTSEWDARIRRANELASIYPFASEGLRFYERIARFQQSLYSDFERQRGREQAACPSDSLRQQLDPCVLLPRFGSFLSLIEEIAPQPLSQSAGELLAAGEARWRNILDDFWLADPESTRQLPPAEAVISWIFLQPYAEYLAAYTVQPATDGTPRLCPLCSCIPQVGVLRREGDGAKRSLICMLCSTEWPYRRIGCPACGEESADKLVVYVAEQFKHIRVEACETCRRCIITVDLTKDGKAVPVVDELAALPLSLWAKENEYTKLTTNVLGV